MAALAAFSQVRGVIPGGDEPHYLAATQSILKDFDLRVANNYADGDYLDYFPGRLEPHFLKRSTSGEIYSIHAPGVSIVVLPAFAVAGYAGAVLTMILIAALTAAITWRLAWMVSGSVAGAWAGAAAVFATTPYFFHTFTIYPEIIGSLCVAIGAWLLIDLADLSPELQRRWTREVTPEDWSRLAPCWPCCRGCTADLRSSRPRLAWSSCCGSCRGGRRLSRLRDFFRCPRSRARRGSRSSG